MNPGLYAFNGSLFLGMAMSDVVDAHYDNWCLKHPGKTIGTIFFLALLIGVLVYQLSKK